MSRREVFRAVRNGDIPQLEVFKSQGFDFASSTEKEKWNLLHQANMNPARTANIDTINFLLKHGASPHDRDVYGNTPLQYAARAKDIASIKALLDSGAEVDSVNFDDLTPLRQTLIQKPFSLEATKTLLDYGADPDLKAGGKSTREYVATIAHDGDSGIAKLFE